MSQRKISPLVLLLAAGCLLAAGSTARANVWLDYDFGEGMTLQSGVAVSLHGKAGREEKVTVSFRGRTYEAQADKLYGRWQVDLEPGDPGGPFALTITGSAEDTKGPNVIELKDVHVAAVTLGQVLGEGMVLQRGGPAPVFGTSVPGSEVTVDFRGRQVKATADAKGAWRAEVEPGDAGGPFAMTIRGPATIKLKQVYVGEVWLCSGQSNMRWGTGYTGKDWGETALRLRKEPVNQLIRLQRYPQDETGYAPNHPPKQFLGWTAADEKSVGNFSGTGYYFGEALQPELKVPLGLIQSAIDATGIRGWTPARELVEMKGGSRTDDIYYQRQILPIMPFAIRGVIWYQGEADTGKDPHGLGYDRRLTGLIQGWRKDWHRGDFPFIFVQLARIGFGAEQVHRGKLPDEQQRQIVDGWARVRDQQRRVLADVPNTAMVVSYDLTTGMLHPPQKKAISARIALAACGLAYGEKIEYSGPLLASAVRDGDKVTLTFTHADGLAARDGEIRQLEVKPAGADDYSAACAKIDGNRIVIDAAGLVGPLAIRYAYREWPDGNLHNAAGLPASPFLVEDVK